MTLTLSPEAEANLAIVAAQRGLAPEDALAQVLAEENSRLAEARARYDEIIADLRQSMADVEAGNWIALEDFEKQFDEQIRRRRANG